MPSQVLPKNIPSTPNNSVNLVQRLVQLRYTVQIKESHNLSQRHLGTRATVQVEFQRFTKEEEVSAWLQQFVDHGSDLIDNLSDDDEEEVPHPPVELHTPPAPTARQHQHPNAVAAQPPQSNQAVASQQPQKHGSNSNHTDNDLESGDLESGEIVPEDDGTTVEPPLHHSHIVSDSVSIGTESTTDVSGICGGGNSGPSRHPMVTSSALARASALAGGTPTSKGEHQEHKSGTVASGDVNRSSAHATRHAAYDRAPCHAAVVSCVHPDRGQTGTLERPPAAVDGKASGRRRSGCGQRGAPTQAVVTSVPVEHNANVNRSAPVAASVKRADKDTPASVQRGVKHAARASNGSGGPALQWRPSSAVATGGCTDSDDDFPLAQEQHSGLINVHKSVDTSAQVQRDRVTSNSHLGKSDPDSNRQDKATAQVHSKGRFKSSGKKQPSSNIAVRAMHSAAVATGDATHAAPQHNKLKRSVPEISDEQLPIPNAAGVRANSNAGAHSKEGLATSVVPKHADRVPGNSGGNQELATGAPKGEPPHARRTMWLSQCDEASAQKNPIKGTVSAIIVVLVGHNSWVCLTYLLGN